MSQNYKERKVGKKQRRCEAIIEKECSIRRSEQPTVFLGVLNAGLATGLTDDVLLDNVSQYGDIKDINMVPGKSYCFLETVTTADAERIYSNVNNKARIGQNAAVVYLGFFEQIPEIDEDEYPYPPDGLIALDNFVTPAEEASILEAIGGFDEETPTNSENLKNRRVKHFGYEFLYGVNNVDCNKPLERQIPAACDILWPRLKSFMKMTILPFDEWEVPDQLTVNYYEPGQGIPQHVDTHSAFLEPILSLSLLGDTFMTFRHGKRKLGIELSARSMLILADEARYDWTHGIAPRFRDVIRSDTGVRRTRARSRRISLTFRKLRKGQCNCKFPRLCDTRLQNTINTTSSRLEQTATQLEELNVHDVYEEIAGHFSETRHKPWPQVASFLQSFSPGAVVVDIGCGNGKYLQIQSTCLTIGCDRSQGLLDICAARGNSIFRCDCLNVPLRTASIDGCISIAVIHHLATPERRLEALREMARLLRKGGRALVYVWAKDQRANTKKSSYLLQNKAINKHKTTEDDQRQKMMQTDSSSASISLPIHTNRTEFQHQDVLVPWKLKSDDTLNGLKEKTLLRYYHVFEQGELEALLDNVTGVKLLCSYYDQGNHCIIFERQ